MIIEYVERILSVMNDKKTTSLWKDEGSKWTVLDQRPSE